MRKRNFWTVATRAFLAVAATFFVFNGANLVRGADASKMRPFFVASSAGSDAVWNAAERIAKEMKFQDVVQGARAIYGDARGLDAVKPFGFVAATDGDAVVAFAFLPISSVDELDFAGADRLKNNIVKTDEGTFYGADKKIELLEKDGWLFVFDASKKASIPTTDPTVWLGETGGDAPLTVAVEFAAIPEEFLEASFATLRLQAANSGGALAVAGGANAEEQLKSFDALLRYYSETIDSLQRAAFAVDVDESTGAFVVDFSATCKNGGPLQETFDAARTGETRWGAVATLENAVFAVANAGKYSDRDKAFLVDYYRTNFFDNILNQLKTALDDPNDFETAQEIVASFEASILAQFENGSFDGASALVGGERPLVVFGSEIAKPDEFRKGVRLLFDAVRKTSADAEKNVDFDEIAKLDATTIDGFSVSTLDFPLSKIAALDKSSNMPPYFADKTIAARFGIKDDAVLFVAGLDVAQVDAEFARIAAGTATKTKAATKSSFAVAPLGSFLAVATNGVSNVNSAARKTFERIAKANDARLTVDFSIEGSRLDGEYVATAELFQLVGDLIRIQLVGGGSNDVEEELDDVFDEE